MRDLAAPTTAVDILIADDELPRADLRFLPEQQGYACAKAGDGRETVEAARRALTLRQAGDLLDWPQSNGYPPGEVAIREEKFAVRCPGFRAYRDENGGTVRPLASPSVAERRLPAGAVPLANPAQAAGARQQKGA